MVTKAKKTPLTCIILAAGKGTRMKTSLPKVLHPVAGRPMLFQVIETAKSLNPARIIVVLAPDMKDLEALLTRSQFGCEVVYQDKQLGTGHAVKCAESIMKNDKGNVLILYGDTPLISADSLRWMEKGFETKKHALVVLGMQCKDPGSYGRLVHNKKGELDAIVEARDADDEQLKINLCNAGIFYLPAQSLFGWLAKIKNKNAQKEYYLTDIVALARKEKKSCGMVITNELECTGVNTRAQLADVNRIVQRLLRRRVMDAGVTLIDPETVYLCTDTRFEQDVVVHPHVVFGPGVAVATGVEIKSFSHIEGTKIASGATIGPFARLRPGSIIGEGAMVGNFVEIKQSVLERGAKASHLSYIGDAHVGEKANIGAGTITCNYDGYNKNRTVIGARAFIGSNSALVAPVIIGDGAIVGAGSVITEDVESDALAVSRAQQKQKPGWAKAFRNRKNN
jgi:bifunctional UDP-N-acetylglucosamine pyrophosphorylase/glucosamine-1-phosphate N-acetyltransferase